MVQHKNEQPNDPRRDEALTGNIHDSLRSGLATRYHRKLGAFIAEDIAALDEVPADSALHSFHSQRAKDIKDALVAEAPLAFRRVEGLRNEHDGQTGLELWKINPTTGKRIPRSVVSLGLAEGSPDDLSPAEVFDGFTPDDLQIAIDRTKLQKEAGLDLDGGPGLEVVPNELIRPPREN